MALDDSGRRVRRTGVLVAWVLASLLSAGAGVAASEFVWLVFKDGTRLSVKPSWTVKPPLIVLTTAEGKLVSVRLSEIDIAATRTLTQATDPYAATVLDAPKENLGRPNAAQHAEKHGLKGGGTFSSLGSTGRVVPAAPTTKPEKQPTPELRESAAEWLRQMNSVACTAEGPANSAPRRACLAKATEAFCRQAYDEKTAALKSCLERAELQRLGKE